jgi:hypothetical protein
LREPAIDVSRWASVAVSGEQERHHLPRAAAELILSDGIALRFTELVVGAAEWIVDTALDVLVTTLLHVAEKPGHAIARRRRFFRPTGATSYHSLIATCRHEQSRSDGYERQHTERRHDDSLPMTAAP